VEPAERQELTEAFDRAIPAGNSVVTEDQQGIVTVDQYPTPQAARYAFDHLPDYGDRGEEDATITPAGPLGSRYAVALAGSFLGYADDMDQASAMLQEAMDADRYWPTPGSSATTATPTASTSGRRDQAPGPLQDWARAQGAVPLVRLRRDWLLPTSVGVLGSRRPSPRWSVTAGTGWVPRLARSPPARPITADPAVCSPANTRASTRGTTPAEESQ
jgi:hypothetical protein